MGEGAFVQQEYRPAYYGNATPPAVTASDVWSNGYVGVWHMNEAGVPLTESSFTRYGAAMENVKKGMIIIVE